MRLNSILILCSLLAISCNKKEVKSSPEHQLSGSKINVPKFNVDSAYFFIKKQVDFGPRIPNTAAHQKASKYLMETLKSFGGSITEQSFESSTYDGKKVLLTNIVASFSPEKQKRIMLAAHWDTRPFADKDDRKPNAQFDGANDGASGVGVLLEIARILNTNEDPSPGIDIILFDGEDWGERNNDSHSYPLPNDLKSWWCLGSQYWAKHKHKKNYAAFYGILLDMVAAKGAKFYREETSLEYAPSIVSKIWNAGERLGYSNIFVKQNIGGITDDHLFVNSDGKIPMVDIIQYDPTHDFFGDYHHTQKDNLDLINKETLRAVGETVLTVIYQEE